MTAVKVWDDLEVGVATHTGQVRRTNEDDFLVLVPEDRDLLERRGRLLVIADGMGGVIGGAEASRAAVRALCRVFLADGDGPDDPERRMRAGFARACETVFELSRATPSLRGMGTTLTAAIVLGHRLVLGHVGDTRCYLLREGRLRQLTTDHVLGGSHNRLTRCIGGGRPDEEVDVASIQLAVDDRLLLATDGIWETVAGDDLRRALAADPQAAAEGLVQLANARGGPDNCTAVVARLVHLDGPSALREIDLPAEEAQPAPAFPHASQPLRAPRWPWLLLGVSAVLGALTMAKLNGINLLDWLGSGW